MSEKEVVASDVPPRCLFLFLAVTCLFDGENVIFSKGQEVHARRFMNEAREEGTWVLFQNCHLSLLFMDEVYNYIQVKTKEVLKEKRHAAKNLKPRHG